MQNPSTDADKEACADQASEGDQVLRRELTVKFVTLCNELDYILPVPRDFVKWLIYRGDGLVYMVEENSRHHSMQTLAWILLAMSSQIYTKNHEQIVFEKLTI